MTYEGKVKGNTIVFGEGVHLPDGLRVTITVEEDKIEVAEVTPEEMNERQAVVARLKEFGRRLAGRNVNLGDLILEERKELENRA
jgi:hypothetical protein